MATMPNTNINIPYSAFLDPTTGRPTQAWLLWLMSPTFITVNIGSALPVTSGGTGLTTIPTNGQLLIGNGTGYTLNTLGYGAGISVTNGSGTIVVANTGVLSIIAGLGISASSPTGNVTLANTGVLSWSGGTTGLTPATATTGAVTLAGTLAIANGGTNGTAIPTAYGVAYGTGTAYAFTAAGTAKQVLIANTSAAPTWSTLTSGTSILYGDGTGGFSNVTIGSGVSFVAGTLSATGLGGTVTSVGLSLPSIMSVSNSPVTTSGTLTGTLTTQAVNTIFAGPSSGAAATPTFRALTTADISSLGYVTSVSGTTGRITSTGGTTPVIDLASGVITAGTTGSITAIPVITVDTYGRVTSITTAANPQGTVTSVGLSLPSIMAVTNSPVTSSGTLTGALTTQAVNSIFAGPSSGAAASPTFRALTTTDIPALSYAPLTSGTSILYGNGSGGFSNVTVGTGLSFTTGTLAATSSTVSAPITKTANFTVGVGETWFINNKTGSSCTVTLPTASSYTGVQLTFKNMQSQTLVSASSNVVPIDSTTAGTAILLGVVGNWATMVSDGTNWVIMQAASNNNLLLE